MGLVEATERMTQAFDEFRRLIADEINPPLYVLAHELHVWWFEGMPWYRKWWHLVTCRHNLDDFTWPSRSGE